MTDKDPPGLSAVRLVFDQGQRIEPAATPQPSPTSGRGSDDVPDWHADMRNSVPRPEGPAAGGGGTVGRGPATEEKGTLPPNCPVTPLGRDGDVLWFLDALGQIRDIRDDKLSRNKIVGLFGVELKWLYDYYARKKPKEGGGWTITGLHTDTIGEDLQAACAKAGVWNAIDVVRAGGWWEDRGNLLLHCGREILVVAPDGQETWRSPGRIGQYVYPRVSDVPRPLPLTAPAAEDDGPAAQLLEVVKTWAWRRRHVDPLLFIGAIGAQMLGAALEWRPMCWLTGDTETGKSTLQKILLLVHGGKGGTVYSSDATGAGIWQAVGFSSLPVRLDELEATEDNRKVNAIILLARQASSGGVVLRGGEAHQGKQFTARNAFIFSSMRVPPLLPQDRNRMAILELDPLPKDAKLPAIVGDEDALKEIGAGLRRRLVMGWPVFGQVLASFKAALAEMGHKNRAQDQFGTLLACAWVMLHDDMPAPSDLSEWCKGLGVAELAELADAKPDWLSCIDHLMTVLMDAHKGGPRHPVSYYIERAAFGAEDDGGNAAAIMSTQNVANGILAAFGLKVHVDGGDVANPQRWLGVAVGNHNGLATLFRDSQWTARPGASTVWGQSLQRAPGHRIATLRLAGKPTRCVLIPFHLALPGEPDWMSRKRGRLPAEAM